MEQKETKKAAKLATRVKYFHMAIGVDLIGSKTSMAASANTTMELYPADRPVGVLVHSRKSDRTILIPLTNIKGMELFTE